MFPPILIYNGYYERGRKIAFNQHVLEVVALGRRLEIQRAWHYSYLLSKGDLIPGSTLRLRKVFTGGGRLLGSSYRPRLGFRVGTTAIFVCQRDPQENAAWKGITIKFGGWKAPACKPKTLAIFLLN